MPQKWEGRRGRMRKASEEVAAALSKPHVGKVLTKEEWIDLVAAQHDLMESAMRRRDENIIRAVAAGATGRDIWRGLRGRLTDERIYQIIRAAGIKPPGKPGRRVGELHRYPKKSGLSHLKGG